jgi:hypothetical protein
LPFRQPARSAVDGLERDHLYHGAAARDGTPDYGAWLNRKYGAGATPENNAAVLLRSTLEPDVLRQMGVDPAAAPDTVSFLGGLGNLGPFEEYLKKQLDDKREVPGIGPLPDDFEGAFAAQHRRPSLSPWRPGEAPLIAAWLTANEANLARIEEVTTTRTRFWIPVSGDLAFETKVPSLLAFCLMGNALRVRALGSAARGDGAGMRRDLIAGLRLGALLEQGPMLIDHLVAVALRGIAAEPIVALANPLLEGRGAARSLLEDLKQLPASIPLDEVLDVNERLLVLGGYVDLYRAGRTSSRAWEDRISSILASEEELATLFGRSPPSSLLKTIPPWAIDWDELLATVNRCWGSPACDDERSQARADLQPAVPDGLLADAEGDRDARRRIARAFLSLEELPSLQRAPISWNEAEAILRLGLVSASAAVSYSERGRYPADARAFGAGESSPGFDPDADHAGYAFRYQGSADGSRFAYWAAPLRSGEAGVRGFCADSRGRLVFTNDGTLPTRVGGLCDPTATVLATRTPPAADR